MTREYGEFTSDILPLHYGADPYRWIDANLWLHIAQDAGADNWLIGTQIRCIQERMENFFEEEILYGDRKDYFTEARFADTDFHEIAHRVWTEVGGSM